MPTVSGLKPPSFVYRLLSPVLFLFWLIHAVIHAYQTKTWRYIPQRLGFIPKPVKNSLWLHASSVGEVNLIQPLCERLISKGHLLTITTFTATGLQRAEELFSSTACISALPIDCWPISSLFRAKLKAKAAIIAETELWPETLFQMANAHIPLIHINARLSKKSLKTAKPILNLLKQTLAYFNVHLCRYPEDIADFKAMDVTEAQLKVLGNLKYATHKNSDTYLNNLINQPYILCASTHDNEEVQLSALIHSKNESFPLLVIAPRHPKRCADIIKALKDHSILEKHIAIRSKNQPISSATKIYLADTLGEMKALFHHAELVIMGGSLVNIGGHNILEPAALAKCIVTGPSDSNIKNDVKALIEHDAIIQVNNFHQLSNEINTLLKQPEHRRKMGENALAYVQSFDQILERYVDHIESVIDEITPENNH